MNKEEFIKFMYKLGQKYVNNEEFYKASYDLFGSSFIDAVANTSYFDMVIEAWQYAIGDTNKWLSYLIYDCDFNLDTFCESINLSDGGHPSINSIGELYDFIKEYDFDYDSK